MRPAISTLVLLRFAAAVLAFCAGVAVTPATGQRPALAMLDGLEKGRWLVRSRGSEPATFPVCIDNGRKLIQLRHLDADCEHLVIADGAAAVTVQYTCRGQGYGRTTIRRESNRLVQIETQGIARGLPFDDLVEARHTGNCAAP